MEIDWNGLPAQLEKYHLQTIQAVAAYADNSEVGIIKVTLHDLTGYVQSWGIKSGMWLVLAVVKMLAELVEEYRTESAAELPMLGSTPPGYFEIAVPSEQEQELCHRILTAYNEIYAVLLRTHRQASSPFWHRRSTVQYFPQLMVESSGTEFTE